MSVTDWYKTVGTVGTRDGAPLERATQVYCQYSGVMHVPENTGYSSDTGGPWILRSAAVLDKYRKSKNHTANI